MQWIRKEGIMSKQEIDRKVQEYREMLESGRDITWIERYHIQQLEDIGRAYNRIVRIVRGDRVL